MGIDYSIYNYVNHERSRNNLSQLVWDNDLAHMARCHSSDMVRHNYFSHFSPYGDDLFVRLERFNYCSHKSCMFISENIGKINLGHNNINPHDENSIARTQVLNWMLSEEHKNNMLSNEISNAGVGISFDSNYFIATAIFL